MHSLPKFWKTNGRWDVYLYIIFKIFLVRDIVPILSWREHSTLIVFITRQLLRKFKNHQLRLGIFTLWRSGGHLMTTWLARQRRCDEGRWQEMKKCRLLFRRQCRVRGTIYTHIITIPRRQKYVGHRILQW